MTAAVPPIDELTRIEPVYLDRLEKQGVFTTGILLEVSETPTRRQTLADHLGATINDVATWRDEALMLNLASFGPDEHRLLIQAGIRGLKGIVSLDPALKGKVSPGDTVFVLARPAGGPKMPLAVIRTTVDKLPYAFTLDDSMAMAPNAKLSGQAEVTVVARISKSGNPLPQKGDIEGASAPVAPGASGVKVMLSKIVD